MAAEGAREVGLVHARHGAQLGQRDAGVDVRVEIVARRGEPDRCVRRVERAPTHARGHAMIPAAEALERLTAYQWPGNIRELRNVIERLVILGTGQGVIADDEVRQVLPKPCDMIPQEDFSRASLEEVEQRHINLVLDTCHGNKTQAAKILAIDYKTLLAKLKKHDLSH